MVKCIECKFYDVPRRECRLLPPIFKGFPEVSDETWCGCGEPRRLEVAPTETVEEIVDTAPAPIETEKAPDRIEVPLVGGELLAVDTNADHYSNREEIMAVLDRLGAKYYRRDSRDVLFAKLMEAANAVQQGQKRKK